MKSIVYALSAVLLAVSAQALAAPKQPIPALETFSKCDMKAMPKAPVKLPGGLVIKKIVKEPPPTPDHKVQIKLVFNKYANPDKENMGQLVERLTGYQFPGDRMVNGVSFGYEEVDGVPDYLVCYK